MSAALLRPGNVPATPRQEKEFLAQTSAENGWHSPNVQTSPEATNDTVPSQATHNRESLFQISPYSEREHLLDLSTLDTPNRLFAQALSVLDASTPTYATTAYADAFDWAVVFSELRSLARSKSFRFPRTEFYVVEFRSKLKENGDRNQLFTLDKQSHREATIAGGLLKYWFGKPNAERRNLATCLWRSKDDAIKGGKGMWHNQARSIIPWTYESINVSGLRLVIEEGAQAWTFEHWSFH